jgi:hypothetical protein
MRQQDMERLLRSDDGAVPDHLLFEGSTTSTPAVKLSRLKKKFEREGNHTIVGVQCYRLDRRELPESLKGAPVLYAAATTLNESTALSKDQLATKVWGARGGSENDVWNVVHCLRDDWDLPILSTGYHQMVVKT